MPSSKRDDFTTGDMKIESFFDQHILEQYGSPRKFSKGNVVFKEGEKGDFLFIVKSGGFKVYLARGGKEKLIARLGPGSIVGEMAVITGKPRMANVEAIEDSDVYIMDKEGLYHVFQKYPYIREAIGKESLKREEENVQKLMEDE